MRRKRNVLVAQLRGFGRAPGKFRRRFIGRKAGNLRNDPMAGRLGADGLVITGVVLRLRRFACLRADWHAAKTGALCQT